MLQEAFTSPASPALPPSMLQGRIILLYKGKGADRASPASYRPMTLLNTDYKLAARTVASRLGPVLNQVVDPTQTGFLPKRWVGDNVLAHLEEISYLEDTQQPGVIVFLDFEKAFDRLDRSWIEQCMAAVGFRCGAQRWVHILHTGTTARVAFNGWHTDAFPVSSGVFQGSPLSPLLFVLATQPMAAHARRRAQQHAFQPIRLPSGDPALVMHQHADDTSIHAQSPSDAQVILDTTVDLHCAATGSKLQRSKSQGLGLGSYRHLEGPDAATGVTFEGRQREALERSPVQAARHRSHSPLHSHPQEGGGQDSALVRLQTQLAGQSVRRRAAACLYGDLSCHLHSSAQPAAEEPVQSSAHLRRREQTSPQRHLSAAVSGNGHLLPRSEGWWHSSVRPQGTDPGLAGKGGEQVAGARTAGVFFYI